MAYLPAKRLPLHIRLNFFMRLSEETKESSYGAHLISLMFIINRKLLWSIFSDFQNSKPSLQTPCAIRKTYSAENLIHFFGMVLVTEKMVSGPDIHHTLIQVIVAIIDAILLVQDTQWRLVRQQHISIVWNAAKQFREATLQIVLDKHGYAVKLDTIDGDGVVAEVMHVVGQTFQLGAIKAKVVVASNKNLVLIRQAAKPFNKVLDFFLGAVLGKVARVDDDVGFRQAIKLTMLAVRVGNV